MTATTPPDLIPLAEWAAQAGVSVRTAQRWADEGLLNGADQAHPQACRDTANRWLVAPHVYTRMQPAPASPQEIDPRALAGLFREFATYLEQKGTPS